MYGCAVDSSRNDGRGVPFIVFSLASITAKSALREVDRIERRTSVRVSGFSDSPKIRQGARRESF